MNSLMRKACCLCGTAVIGGLGFLEMGCAGSYEARVQISPFGILVDVTFVPLLENEQFDLDGLHYVLIYRDGKSYRFYPSKGWVFDPETGRLYQLDDESWKKLNDELQDNPLLEVSVPLPQINQPIVTREVLGIIFPTVLTGLGIPDEMISVELALEGDTPLPTLSATRWPTLDRKLFVFPNGVQGEPDDMRLELNGDPSDVLGYMAAVGVTEGETIVDGCTWKVILHNEELAEIYFNDMLFNSVSIH
ncbi:MAG: hypothetical protein HOC27_00320 [Phycisphaerae bacterium]|nr:hypothetical protein [Phycisphaerae bacterium]